MFKRSKAKIVALLMAILVLTLLGTIAVIYGTSYAQMSRENREMLELYAKEYLENGGLPESDDERAAGAEELLAGQFPEEALSEERAPGEGLPEEGISEGDFPEAGASEEGLTEAVMSEEELPEEGLPGEERTEPDLSRRRLQLSTFYSVVFDGDGTVLTVNNDDPSQVSDEVLTEIAQSFLDTGKTYGISRNMIYLVSGEEYTLVSMMDNTLISESIYTLLRYTVIFGAAAIVVVLFLAIFLANRIIQPLEENYKRQNQFISDAGHELKTPVSTISTNAELLQREIGENRWLENIRYENGRMTAIVRSLLDLLRAESPQPVMERVDLGRIVTAGTLPFEGKAFEQGVDLSCEAAGDVFIMGQPQQLEKLVSILIDNAFAHTNPPGCIRVSLADAKGTAVLSVANEGEPIPLEAQDKIFDRFYRVDVSRTVSGQNETAHYGLGLSIAKAIALAHRARISVECSGGITKFTVEFSQKTKRTAN